MAKFKWPWVSRARMEAELEEERRTKALVYLASKTWEDLATKLQADVPLLEAKLTLEKEERSKLDLDAAVFRVRERDWHNFVQNQSEREGLDFLCSAVDRLVYALRDGMSPSPFSFRVGARCMSAVKKALSREQEGGHFYSSRDDQISGCRFILDKGVPRDEIRVVLK